jgi:GTP cyclohydrolase I
MTINECYKQLLKDIPDFTEEQREKASVRAAQAFEFLTSGYALDLQTLAGKSLYPCPESGQVMIKNIEFMSLCEHHLLPMLGKCHIVYEPKELVLGLGKISDIVHMFSHRLQLQEKLTSEIAHGIMEITKARGAAVMIEGHHLCTALQGAEKAHQLVVTDCFLGSFANESIDLFR